ncbi:MAG: 3-dehydroquinate synthase family protein [Acidimicrobiales bacterium]
MRSDYATVDVALGDRSYPVFVGPGVSAELSAVVPSNAKRVAVITQDAIGVEVDAGVESRVFTIPDGEQFKTLETVEDLCRQWVTWGLTRNDVVVAVGGGLVTDVGGFAASVYHRGIPVIHVPTTLLGQIDAAVGGKTGVNLPEGKNLVGAYWQPSAVLCDTDLLATLPKREWNCGYGEMAKYEFLGAGELRGLNLADQVERCVRLKAAVVSDDEREGNTRAILNYGHTLAHALEISGSFDLRHGEAVAIGLVYAAQVAQRLGRIDAERVDYHRDVIAGYDLKSVLPTQADPADLLTLFARDKKALDGVTFVLDGPSGVEAVGVNDEALLTDALEAMR